ncbi:hypothetical protein D3C86_1563590 [compost metagenome]
MRAFVEWRNEDLLVLDINVRACFSRCRRKDGIRLRVRGETLALPNANRCQDVDHHFIARQPRFGLHEAVKCVEICRIVGDG